MNIEDMAREACGQDACDSAWVFTQAELERFAVLVRAAALEEAAQACRDKSQQLSQGLDDEDAHTWRGGRADGWLEAAHAIRALAKPVA
jgi:hypothetical protein